jgi:hypothetical protein
MTCARGAAAPAGLAVAETLRSIKTEGIREEEVGQMEGVCNALLARRP